jgi:hypothetical protein
VLALVLLINYDAPRLSSVASRANKTRSATGILRGGAGAGTGIRLHCGRKRAGWLRPHPPASGQVPREQHPAGGGGEAEGLLPVVSYPSRVSLCSCVLLVGFFANALYCFPLNIEYHG